MKYFFIAFVALGIPFLTILERQERLALGSLSLLVHTPSIKHLTKQEIIADVQRISVAFNGGESNGWSGEQAISADGRYVTFASVATNLVPNDNNDQQDIFVYDRQTNQMTCVSMAFDGTQANLYSLSPSISGDGQQIVFVSEATNLVPDDVNGLPDVFVHDLRAGATTRVSVGLDGIEASGSSSQPAISSDGRFVAFSSMADNLVLADTNQSGDIFVYELQTGAISRVSVASDGSEANGISINPVISADGRFISFNSLATNLTSNDGNSRSDVFIHDRHTGQRNLISVAVNGSVANNESFKPAISGNDRYVAFVSRADNLVIGDTNDVSDVFVYDRQTGQMIRVSSLPEDAQLPAADLRDAYSPAIASDGRFVSFYRPPNFFNPDFKYGSFVYDLYTGQVVHLSQGYDEANGIYEVAISVDNRWFAFATHENLIPEDTNDEVDVYVYENTLTHEAYSLSGRVVNPIGQPVAGVLVSANESYQAMTDNNGVYTLTLIAGTYQLTVTTERATVAPSAQSIQVPSDTPPLEFILQWVGETTPTAESLVATITSPSAVISTPTPTVTTPPHINTLPPGTISPSTNTTPNQPDGERDNRRIVWLTGAIFVSGFVAFIILLLGLRSFRDHRSS
jgi:Tol biopolymer transport system component